MNAKPLGFILLVLLLAVFGSAANVQPVEANANEIYVDDSNTEGPWEGTYEDPYQNITTALTHASKNDAIFVCNGTYHEKLIINQTVRLIGENRNTTIIDGESNGTVVTVRYVENVTIAGFTIRNSGGEGPDRGIFVWKSSGIEINNNIITNNSAGLELRETNSSKIACNIIANNLMSGESSGIRACQWSNDNQIYGNKIENNGVGVRLSLGSQNPSTVFLNNLINNTLQATGSAKWDNGVEGNYWNDYNGTDNNDDGIGDNNLPHLGLDYYPLMGPVAFFNAGTWNETTYYVYTISNSTVSQLQFDPDDTTIRFEVDSGTSKPSFCRVAIPRELLWCNSPEDWIVIIDTTPVSPNVIQNENYTYIYFSYNQGGKTVYIKGEYAIPEFSTWIILPLTMALMLSAIILVLRNISLKKRTNEKSEAQKL